MISRFAILFLIASLCSCSSTNFYKRQSSGFYLKIEEHSLPAMVHYTYVIHDWKLYVVKTEWSNLRVSLSKKVRTYRINKAARESILAQAKNLNSLEDKYITPVIDGLRHKISLDISDEHKEIVVVNTHVEEIQKMFDILNKLLPKRRYHILSHH